MYIHIEFCEKWNYGPEFERVSNIIKQQNSTAKINGNDKAPRTGSFEVTINDKLIYSKLNTNNFPTENEVSEWFENL